MIQVKGIPEFDRSVVEWGVRMREAALEFVEKGGQKVADSAKEEFVGGTHDYPWQGPNFPHPTAHSGFLRDSISVDNVRVLTEGAMSEVGPHTVYGRRVELGYVGTGHWPYFTTRPFPFMRPGLEKAMPELQVLFRELVLLAQEA